MIPRQGFPFIKLLLLLNKFQQVNHDVSNFTVSRVKLYIYIYRCTFKFGVQGRSASDSGKGHKLFIVGCVGFEQSLPNLLII